MKQLTVSAAFEMTRVELTTTRTNNVSSANAHMTVRDSIVNVASPAKDSYFYVAASAILVLVDTELNMADSGSSGYVGMGTGASVTVTRCKIRRQLPARAIRGPRPAHVPGGRRFHDPGHRRRPRLHHESVRRRDRDLLQRHHDQPEGAHRHKRRHCRARRRLGGAFYVRCYGGGCATNVTAGSFVGFGVVAKAGTNMAATASNTTTAPAATAAQARTAAASSASTAS